MINIAKYWVELMVYTDNQTPPLLYKQRRGVSQRAPLNNLMFSHLKRMVKILVVVRHTNLACGIKLAASVELSPIKRDWAVKYCTTAITNMLWVKQ